MARTEKQVTDAKQGGREPEPVDPGTLWEGKHIGRRAFLGLVAAGFLGLVIGPKVFARVVPPPLCARLFSDQQRHERAEV